MALHLSCRLPSSKRDYNTPSLPELATTLQTTGSRTQQTHSICFIGFAIGVFIWGILSDRIGRRPSMLYGILFYIGGSILVASIIFLLTAIFILSVEGQAVGYIASIFLIMMGIGIALPSCLSNALLNYRDCLGISGALLCLFYYLQVGLITGGMSILHTGSTSVLPLYIGETLNISFVRSIERFYFIAIVTF